MTPVEGLSAADLAIDRELADIALGYRFLLDVTPVNLDDARHRFMDRGTPPEFRYRPLEDDVDVVASRLAKVDTHAVEDTTLSHMLQAKHREVGLQIEMLRCRGSTDFLPLSTELYGAVSPILLAAAEQLLDEIGMPPPSGSRRWTPRRSHGWPRLRWIATARHSPSSTCRSRCVMTGPASWSSTATY